MLGPVLQAGLRSGLQYSVTVEQAQPRLGPRKGRSRAAAPPQVFQLDDVDVGFDSIEVGSALSIERLQPSPSGCLMTQLSQLILHTRVENPACLQNAATAGVCRNVRSLRTWSVFKGSKALWGPWTLCIGPSNLVVASSAEEMCDPLQSHTGWWPHVPPRACRRLRTQRRPVPSTHLPAMMPSCLPVYQTASSACGTAGKVSSLDSNTAASHVIVFKRQQTMLVCGLTTPEVLIRRRSNSARSAVSWRATH